MNILKKIVFLIFAFVMSACTSPAYLKENAAFIVFKTPTFKYADMGFIYESHDEVKVEIYASGQVLMKLEIAKNSICMSLLECMPTKSFNDKVLSVYYPDHLLDDVFRGKAIFAGLGLKKQSNGFTQNIRKTNQYNIEYSVLNGAVIFRDTMNAILIKIKKQY